MAAPSNLETVTSSIFDLDSFDSVSLTKQVSFVPMASADEALELASNDPAKFLRIINAGLRDDVRRAAKNDPNGWVTEEGEPFSGTPADDEKVNSLVLTLAKTLFGFSKEMTPDQKKGAKTSARDMIKSTPAILDNLKKTAALGQ